MRLRFAFSVLALAVAFATVACSHPSSTSSSGAAAPAVRPSTYGRIPGPIPDNGFKAQLDLNNPPAKLRAGERVTVEVHVKNASDVIWYARGAEINTNPSNQFYLAVGDRWLQPDGKLVTNMDGRLGVDKDLKPGEETTLPLQVTAPKEPGDYLLEVDLVQEQVAWFGDKGSPTARTKISVVR